MRVGCDNEMNMRGGKNESRATTKKQGERGSQRKLLSARHAKQLCVRQRRGGVFNGSCVVYFVICRLLLHSMHVTEALVVALNRGDVLQITVVAQHARLQPLHYRPSLTSQFCVCHVVSTQEIRLRFVQVGQLKESLERHLVQFQNSAFQCVRDRLGSFQLRLAPQHYGDPQISRGMRLNGLGVRLQLCVQFLEIRFGCLDMRDDGRKECRDALEGLLSCVSRCCQIAQTTLRPLQLVLRSCDVEHRIV